MYETFERHQYLPIRNIHILLCILYRTSMNIATATIKRVRTTATITAVTLLLLQYIMFYYYYLTDKQLKINTQMGNFHSTYKFHEQNLQFILTYHKVDVLQKININCNYLEVLEHRKLYFLCFFDATYKMSIFPLLEQF